MSVAVRSPQGTFASPTRACDPPPLTAMAVEPEIFMMGTKIGDTLTLCVIVDRWLSQDVTVSSKDMAIPALRRAGAMWKSGRVEDSATATTTAVSSTPCDSNSARHEYESARPAPPVLPVPSTLRVSHLLISCVATMTACGLTGSRGASTKKAAVLEAELPWALVSPADSKMVQRASTGRVAVKPSRIESTEDELHTHCLLPPTSVAIAVAPQDRRPAQSKPASEPRTVLVAVSKVTATEVPVDDRRAEITAGPAAATTGTEKGDPETCWTPFAVLTVTDTDTLEPAA
mmetsp:Transcript_10965/g.24944  ORF Transcript_10965/g.24944 Transcript_10965/m.24944 type:complete len:288 (-) Transcript_10965:4885-5748(-)